MRRIIAVIPPVWAAEVCSAEATQLPVQKRPPVSVATDFATPLGCRELGCRNPFGRGNAVPAQKDLRSLWQKTAIPSGCREKGCRNPFGRGSESAFRSELRRCGKQILPPQKESASALQCCLSCSAASPLPNPSHCKALRTAPTTPGVTLPIRVRTANASGGAPHLKTWVAPQLITRPAIGRAGIWTMWKAPLLSVPLHCKPDIPTI